MKLLTAVTMMFFPFGMNRLSAVESELWPYQCSVETVSPLEMLNIVLCS